VGLVDGATWIREQMQLHFAELDALGLDFYHMSEMLIGHVARCWRGISRGKRGATNCARVKHEGCSAAWIAPSVAYALRGKVKRKAADRLLHFISGGGR